MTITPRSMLGISRMTLSNLLKGVLTALTITMSSFFFISRSLLFDLPVGFDIAASRHAAGSLAHRFTIPDPPQPAPFKHLKPGKIIRSRQAESEGP